MMFFLRNMLLVFGWQLVWNLGYNFGLSVYKNAMKLYRHLCLVSSSVRIRPVGGD